jgi:linoleoyl-CoA desaturase
MQSLKVKYNNKLNADFAAETKQKVYQYFEDKGISTYANLGMVLITFCLLALYFVPLILILSNKFSEFNMLLMCIIMGIGVAGIGFAVQHDANHGAYSSKEWVNKMLGFTLSLVGGNDYMWRIKHNVLHHTFTNIHGKDEDISVAKFLRLSPAAPYKPIHKYQPWLAWFAYSILTLGWVFYFDFPKIKRYNGYGSPNPESKHPISEIILLFVMKLLYFFTMLILPILVLDIVWWKILIGFVSMHLVAGLILTTVFQLAHVVEDAEFPVPDSEGNVESSWFVSQLLTTSNFCPSNKLLTWYVGGLNFQIEHHLFPKICSIHYPEISKIVRQTAEKYGISYHSTPSLTQALASHQHMLVKFSSPNPIIPINSSNINEVELALT